jgi:hypothetical protein
MNLYSKIVDKIIKAAHARLTNAENAGGTHAKYSKEAKKVHEEAIKLQKKLQTEGADSKEFRNQLDKLNKRNANLNRKFSPGKKPPGRGR